VNRYDVIVVGAGPAGSVCAAFCARTGRRTLLLERAEFPRDKVCGDCLNPAVWPILDRLALRDRLFALPHAIADRVVFRAVDGACVNIPIAPSASPEMVVKRSIFDQLLVERAIECGAEFRSGVSVTSVRPGWEVTTSMETFRARIVVAADGRNSGIARQAGLLAPATRERTALQTHLPADTALGNGIVMRFSRHGYGGLARVNADELNLCLVATPDRLERVRAEARAEFGLSDDHPWRSVAPLSRRPADCVARDGLFLVGDAARVVEPFTGEGIYYAMRSGELAADAITTDSADTAAVRYRTAHRATYRGRLWINQLAKLASLHPEATSLLFPLFRAFPAPLRMITGQVLRARDAQ
jgi:geranylgeranyl reductase family protein